MDCSCCKLLLVNRAVWFLNLQCLIARFQDQFTKSRIVLLILEYSINHAKSLLSAKWMLFYNLGHESIVFDRFDLSP